MMRLNPIIKRELEVQSRRLLLPSLVTVILGVLFLIGLLGAFGVAAGMRQSLRMDYAPMMHIYALTVLSGFSMLLLLSPLFTCGAVTKEREGGTFDLLLTTRLTPSSIVLEKMLSSLTMASVLIGATLPALLIPLMYGGVGAWRTVLLLLLFIPEAVLLLSIGMFSSAVGRTTIRSTASAYATTLLLIAGPVILALLCRPFTPEGQNRAAYLLSLDPVLPVAAELCREIGRPDLITRCFALLGLRPDAAYLKHIVLTSVLTQLSLSVVLIVLSIHEITPGRRHRRPKRYLPAEE